MLLYILLAIIAIGVLLASNPGRVFLLIILAIGLACFVLYIGFYLVLFLLAIFFNYKSKFPPIFSEFPPIFRESEYDWILGAIIGVVALGAAIYKALYPFGYNKNRKIWTGKMKTGQLTKVKNEKD